MERVCGWTIFEKEQMNEENAITVLSEISEKLSEDIQHWKPDSGMGKLLECQKEALKIAIFSLRNN